MILVLENHPDRIWLRIQNIIRNTFRSEYKNSVGQCTYMQIYIKIGQQIEAN